MAGFAGSGCCAEMCNSARCTVLYRAGAGAVAAASGETAGTRGTLPPGFPGSSSWYRGKIGTDGQALLVSAKLKLVQARTSLGGINASLCVGFPVVREKEC